MDIGYRAIMLTIYLSAPILGFGLIAGLAISIFQAVTSIQEMTLTFVPKILAVMLAVTLFGSWMMSQIIDFTTNLFNNLPNFIR